jgi:hypothetical protein
MEYYILIKLAMNWADEFDVDSFWVTTQARYDRFLKTVINFEFNDDDEIYFGTNEFVSFSSTDKLLSSLKVTPITKEFHDQLIAHFGEEYGLIYLTRIEEYAEQKIYEDEEYQRKEYVSYGIQ